MFNKLPKYVRIVSSCSADKFKSQLDKHLRNIVDLPCQSGFNNSLDGGDCLNGGHYADDLAVNPSYSPTSHNSTQLPTIQQRSPFRDQTIL